MKHIYCISGLGADEKVFSKLSFKGYELHFITWLIPHEKENISVYAKRLAEQIRHDGPVLIGLSFGGMICIEIAKQVSVEKIFLISSCKSINELPLWMRLSGKLKLNRIFPMKSFRLIEPLENYNLGVETFEEKEMVKLYRRKVDQRYLDWAINCILNWNNMQIPSNIYHIHGNRDRIFPAAKVKADCIIDTGGHLMIMNRHEAINNYIDSILHKPSVI